MPSVFDEVIIIPARYRSTRLPGKPLIPVGGKPMIVQTHARCLEVLPREQIIVATDDERIAAVCLEHDMRVEMTADGHFSGTDRVAEIASRVPALTYLNVQGDEPVCNPDDLRRLIAAARADRGRVIIGYCAIDSEAEWRDPHCCKMLFSPGGELIYISRAPVPATRTNDFRMGHRQVCIHAFPPDALRAFASVGARARIEAIEDVEMLRFLELGRKVHVLEMSDQSVSVDRESDVPRAEAMMRRVGLLH